jgi:hypothetical protein
MRSSQRDSTQASASVGRSGASSDYNSAISAGDADGDRARRVS